MSQVEQAASPSGPNMELVSVLVNAQDYAIRLKDEKIRDFHLLWAVLGTSAVSAPENIYAKIGLRRNTADLAIRSAIGTGAKKDLKAAVFSRNVRKLYDATIEQAALEGKQATPADLLGNILEYPSTTTKMVVNTLIEDYLRRSGAPNIASSRAEVWAYNLAEGASEECFTPKIRLTPSTEAFLEKLSTR